jgi:hypothetical protein
LEKDLLNKQTRKVVSGSSPAGTSEKQYLKGGRFPVFHWKARRLSIVGMIQKRKIFMI